MAYEYGGDPVSAMYGGQMTVATAQQQMKQLPMQTQQMQYTLEQQRVTLSQAEAILNIQRNMAQKAAQRNTSTEAGKLMGPRDQITEASNNMLDMAKAYMYSSPELSKQYVEMADKLIANQGLADERHLNTIIKDYQTIGAQIPLDASPDYVRQVATQFQHDRPDDAKEMYGGIIAQLADGTLTATPQIIKMMHEGAMTGLQQAQQQLAQVHEGTARSEAESARINAEAHKEAVRLQAERDAAKLKAQGSTGLISETQRKTVSGAMYKYGINVSGSDDIALTDAQTGIEKERRRMVNQDPKADPKDSTLYLDEATRKYFGENPPDKRKLKLKPQPKPKGTTSGASTPAATPREFKSEADIPADLPKGTPIIVGGVPGTWQ